MTAVTAEGGFLQRPCIRQVVHGEFAFDQSAVDDGAAPWVDVRGVEVPVERGLVRPQFREADEPRVERVDGGVVGDAAVAQARGFDERLEMRQHLGDALGREAESSENGDGGGHGLDPSIDRSRHDFLSK